MSLRTGLMVRQGSCQGEEVLEAFVLELQAEGVRVGGVFQRTVGATCARKRMTLVDALSGAEIPISQDLGSGSNSCVLDGDGLASAAVAVQRAMRQGIDLLVFNKFSSRECDGKGLAPEMFNAMADGVPVLTTIAERYVTRWQEMSGGLGSLLPAELPALRAWWERARSLEIA
jgi:hypothetical protein